MKPVFLTTDISDFTQLHGRTKRKTRVKTLVCYKRDTATTCLFCRDLHLTFFCFCFCFLTKKICFNDGDVWWKGFSNRIIVTLVSQGLPSSFLSSAVAFVH